MKRLLASLLFLAATAANAHVLLTTPYSVSGPPGVATCSAPHMTAIQWTPVTSGTGTLTGVTIIYQLGTATFSGGVDTGWTPSTCAPAYTFALSFVTGQWTLTTATGQLSGQMVGAVLTTAQSNYLGSGLNQFNDYADKFLVTTGSGLLSTAFGTRPDLWGLGDN
jgi:hypothetical protein